MNAPFPFRAPAAVSASRPQREYPLDLTGIRFGRLVALRRVKGNDGAAWVCQCDCGRQKTVLRRSLRWGSTTSCGCAVGGKPKHGDHARKLYRVWGSMKARCSNPNNQKYHLYGGKGITVCEAWLSYPAFRDWALASGYRDGLSIERRDGDAGYCPENCTWATALEQARNLATTRRSPTGEAWVAIAERHGVSATAYRSRVHIGWPDEKAATTPVKKRMPA